MAKSLIKIIDIFADKYTTTISRCKKKASQLTLAQKISDFLIGIRKIKAGTKKSGAKLDFKLSKCQETLAGYKDSVLLYQERVYKADDDARSFIDFWEDSVDPIPGSKEELLHNTNIAQPIYCFFRDPECCSVEYDRTKLARLKGTSMFRRNTSPLTISLIRKYKEIDIHFVKEKNL